MIDSDDNVILFTFTDDESTKMKAYVFSSKEQKFIDLQLDKDEYDLNLNTHNNNLVFNGNSIFSIVKEGEVRKLIRVDLN